jgi:hypothetical protein
MNMQVGTLKILEAAHFPAPQAQALADAIEYSVKSEIGSTQWVTVPILDARFKETVTQLRLEMAQMENRLVSKGLTVGFSLAGLVLTAVYFMLLHFAR